MKDDGCKTNLEGVKNPGKLFETQFTLIVIWAFLARRPVKDKIQRPIEFIYLQSCGTLRPTPSHQEHESIQI